MGISIEFIENSIIKYKNTVLEQNGNPLLAEVIQVTSLQYVAGEDACNICKYFDGTVFLPLSEDWKKYSIPNKLCKNSKCRCGIVYSEDPRPKIDKIKPPSDHLLKTGEYTQEDLDFINRSEIEEQIRQEKNNIKMEKEKVYKDKFLNEIETAFSLLEKGENEKSKGKFLKAFTKNKISLYQKNEAVKRLIKLKKYNMALKLLEYAIEVNSKKPLVHFKSCYSDSVLLKAKIYKYEKNIQALIDLFNTNLEIAWSPTNLLFWAKATYQFDPKFAEKCCSKALKINPEQKSLKNFVIKNFPELLNPRKQKSIKEKVNSKSSVLSTQSKPVKTTPSKKWYEFWK